jgi:hypothetical protein
VSVAVEPAQPEEATAGAPKTARDVLRVIELALPGAMIAIDQIAERLGVPLRDAIRLVRLAETDGLITRWADAQGREHCFLSEPEAKRRRLDLVTTDARGKARPSEWYWVQARSSSEKGVPHDPWSISLSMLPGPRRNRIWWRARLRRLAGDRMVARSGGDDGPGWDPSKDPELGGIYLESDPMEEDQRRDRLLEVAQWTAAKAARQLPPRRCDRQGWAKSDRTEYSRALRPRLLIGAGQPGWTPAHEGIRGQHEPGACLVCLDRNLKADELCLGCLRSGMDWWLEMIPQDPNVV